MRTAIISKILFFLFRAEGNERINVGWHLLNDFFFSVEFNEGEGHDGDDIGYRSRFVNI